MDYLDYEGLKYYHSKVKGLINDVAASIPEYKAGDDIAISDYEISLNASTISNPEIDVLWSGSVYTVDLNGEWRLSTTVSNPDPQLYEGVYESFAHKGQNSTYDSMYIDINGYESFYFYIRNYSESCCDHVMVSQLDQTITDTTSVSSSAVFAHTRDTSTSTTTISGYQLVQFSNIDKMQHRIQIIYKKDGSQSSGDDRGYVLIPKHQ